MQIPVLRDDFKPNHRLIDGSVQLRSVSVVVKNDNHPGSDETGQPIVGL